MKPDQQTTSKWNRTDHGDAWASINLGTTKFKYNIEEWCRLIGNIELLRLALDGDEEILDWLPHWVATGVIKMKKDMKDAGI